MVFRVPNLPYGESECGYFVEKDLKKGILHYSYRRNFSTKSMRKGPIKIPVEVLDRTIEFYSGMPSFRSLKFKGHGVVRFQNLFSHLSRVHHFDSVREFLTYQDNLASTDRVAFHEVEVIGMRDDRPLRRSQSGSFRPRLYPYGDRTAKKSCLELDLADRTGQTKLVYPHFEFLREQDNTVFHGAEMGDKVEIYAAKYRGINEPLLLLTNFNMRNDAHYKRLQNLRW